MSDFKIEYNKKLLILFLAILGIVFLLLIVNHVMSRGSSEDVRYKISDTEDYIYTLDLDSSTESEVPYVNLKGVSVNDEIASLTSPYVKSNDSNQSVTYRYNESGDTVSLVLIFRDFDNEEHLVYHFKTYVFKLSGSVSLLSSDEILRSFDITYPEVNKKIGRAMLSKYKDEVKKGYFSQSDCDYACYLSLRGITNYLDDCNYYIEDQHLIVYRAFDAYSQYEEENYFTRDDFKFVIK